MSSLPTLVPSFGTPFLYLACAALLLWATRRLIRPLSLPAAIILGLLPLVFTGPALLSGGVYAPLDLQYRDAPLHELGKDFGLTAEDFSRTRYDVAFRLIPWRKATRYAIKHGEWPIWNPFMLSGDILAAAAEPAVYHPIHLASYLLPLGPSLTFVAALFLLVAGLGAFCYIREIGCVEAAAMLGAAGWMFSNFMLFWMGWPLSLTLAFFPLLLLAVRRVVRTPGWRSSALLAAAFVLVVLAGHPESSLHCVAVAMIYGLCELAAAGRGSPGPAIAWSLAAALLALLLCAVYLLPVFEALPQTRQYHWRRSPGGVAHSVPWQHALERLRTAVVWFAYGVPWGEWIKVPRFMPLAPYVGSVLLAPALFGLWRGRWRGRWLLLGLLVFGFLMHASTPFLSDLLARLPLFDITINRRLAFVAAFAVPVLAALGADAWIREPTSRRLGALSLGVLAALGLAIALLWAGMREDGLSARFLGSWTLLELAPLGLTTALFFTVRSARTGVWLLLAVLLAQRWLQTAELNPTYPQSLFAPTVEELAALPRDGAPYRIVGLGSSLPPNLSSLWELEDPRGATPMANRRLSWTFFLWTGPDRHRFDGKITDLGRPFLSFLNVRFALVAKGAPVSEGWRPFIEGRGFSIYENPGALARAFVPERVRVGEPLPRMRRDMETAADFSSLAWIEERGRTGLHPAGEIANGPGRVTAVERRGLGLRVEAAMERPGWVVVSQTAWEGWRATADGRELPLHYGNHAFLAFHLPEGRHRVKLVYRPRSFVVGRAISSATAAILALVWLGSGIRRRASGNLPSVP